MPSSLYEQSQGCVVNSHDSEAKRVVAYTAACKAGAPFELDDEAADPIETLNPPHLATENLRFFVFLFFTFMSFISAHSS